MQIVTESSTTRLAKATISIQGMTCASCVKAIETALKQLPSVQKDSVAVNLLVGSATLTASPDLCPLTLITETIENAGYDVTACKYLDSPSIPISKSNTTSTYKVSLHISGMFCISCSSKVESLLKSLQRVIPLSVKVSLATGQAQFEYQVPHDQPSNLMANSAISDKIRELGFETDNIKIEKVLDDDQTIFTNTKEDTGAPSFATTRLDISGMTCASCVSAIESSLGSLQGIRSVQVNLLAKSGVIVHDPTVIGVRDLISAVEDTGFDVALAEDDAVTRRDGLQEKIKREELLLRRRLLLSLVFAVPMFIIAMVMMMMLPKSNSVRVSLMREVISGLRIQDIIMFILATPVQFWLAQPFYKKAYRALRYTRTANMETLVSLGTSVAYFASLGSIIAAMAKGGNKHHSGDGMSMGMSSTGVDFFETAVFLVTFINLGKWLEAMAKGKTAETITKLMDLQPETATLVKADESLEEIPAALIQVGDILLVNAGGRIPCDGILWKGNTMVDEAMITGESLPIQKTERKSKLISASINLSSVIQVKATKVGKDTTLSRIIQLVQDAQASPKAPIEALGDKISGVFVPIVIVLALLTFAGWAIAGSLGAIPDGWIPEGESYWIYATLYAVAVLVIACPCALGLASPTAVMVGTGIAAKYGILVKGGGFALEMAKRLDIVVFDKTGTLTTGKPKMTDSWIVPTADRTQSSMILEILGKVEAGSNHPVALAVAKGAAEMLYKSSDQQAAVPIEDASDEDEDQENESRTLQKQFNHVKVSHTREVPGRGLSATVTLGDNLTLDGYGQFRALNVLIGNEKWMKENGAHYPTQVASDDRRAELGRWQSEGKSVVLCAISPAANNSGPSEVLTDRVSTDAATIASQGTDATCKCELCVCIDCNYTTKLGTVNVPLIIAQVAVADTARPEAAEVIAGLESQGIETWMLTGDHPVTAQAIARQLGINKVIAGVLPEDKAAKVRQLQQTGRSISTSKWSKLFKSQHHQSSNPSVELSPIQSQAMAGSDDTYRQLRPAIVAMVGDGINDSPALAQSNLGISVGSATDIAIEAASIVLLHDTLTDLLVMRDLAKTTVRRIQINFMWAFMYNVVMIPIAAGVLVPWNRSAVIGPTWAGLAMAASSVSVILSSLRLRSYRYRGINPNQKK
ncbi:ATPase Cu transporting protein 7B [Lobosporangium transversale]|uniref:P-type Cu(+) transporter n=1 Tax=Lobosporangium transversale TaxID=64571 RepID=A0A1Y2GHF9_9FUNG|nr:E1-E2 ATPase-domain-containing protein [Lobosporangium transversale]KAF9913471.1 ATPase Cu transporting protein 7B [Lobosporangium transversale]ORZ09733.1 E1-E2 ATPase-domain-containing protein [Lobosporangium transversale]|eukprot:XP_021879003.1 E1-E2 ATPase-domain-containing protein [Lobosporangium transversale]